LYAVQFVAPAEPEVAIEVVEDEGDAAAYDATHKRRLRNTHNLAIVVVLRIGGYLKKPGLDRMRS